MEKYFFSKRELQKTFGRGTFSKLFFLIFFILFAEIVSAQVVKESYLYSEKENYRLTLDRYYTTKGADSLKPSIIFMFGGGFYTGKRDASHYIPFFEYYAEKGYNVFSIDYRLGFKDADLAGKKSISRFIKIVNHTINMAVEDLFDATNFIIEKADEWNLDTSLIVPYGSSAGGITVLHAEYNLANGTALAERLPEGFRYGGVVSSAGAIFSSDGRVKWKSKPSPILMFHGNADSNVPYHKYTIFGKGFYGSKYIAKRLKKDRYPYYFETFDNFTHEISSRPMNNNRDDIDEFLNKMVIRKEPLMINKVTTDLLRDKKKKRFGLKDYIRSNFQPR